jgi:hypothetical protein
VAFFHSPPGLAFLHRLVLALHVVCVEVGACGMGAFGDSYGPQMTAL